MTGRIPRRLRDGAVPFLLATLATIELAGIQAPNWVTGLALEYVACALLIARRQFPLAAPLAATLVALSLPLVDPALDQPATPALIAIYALYSLARYNPSRRATAAFVVFLVPAALYTVAVDEGGVDVTNFVFVGGTAACPFIAGRFVRRFDEQTAQLAAQQEIIRHDAILAERHRIARDLHDVIAHSLSAMVVQTSAAQEVVSTDPDRALELLDNVADTGRAALAETGRLLHLIRDDANELGLEPAPGLGRLMDLVGQFRDNGLTVQLVVAEPLPPLGPGADVSAFRIVQEALTNALKHAPDRTVQLGVEAQAGHLIITATNWSDGHRGGGSGLGLIGMRERLAVIGGDLRHGLTPDGRYALTATLPIGDSA
jgi:signal transduction histidine kinase